MQLLLTQSHLSSAMHWMVSDKDVSTIGVQLLNETDKEKWLNYFESFIQKGNIIK